MMLKIDIDIPEPDAPEVTVDDYYGENGETDYNRLINKPCINGIELRGNVALSGEDIGLQYADNFDIEGMF